MTHRERPLRMRLKNEEKQQRQKPGLRRFRLHRRKARMSVRLPTSIQAINRACPRAAGCMCAGIIEVTERTCSRTRAAPRTDGESSLGSSLVLLIAACVIGWRFYTGVYRDCDLLMGD